MAKNRITFFSDITLTNEKVGIGTSSAIFTLDVNGIFKSVDMFVAGISTFSVFSGFTRDQSFIGDNILTNANQGENFSLSEDIIVLSDSTLTVGSGTTVKPAATKSLTTKNHLCVPVGVTTSRSENPIEGTIRFNDDLNTLEFWNGFQWRQFSYNITRCRGIFGGGYNAPGTAFTNLEFVNISTTGNTTDFGQLTVGGYGISFCSSSIRGIGAGGWANPTRGNVLDYTTIASEGNAIDFGDLTQARGAIGACSSSTRGLFGGGYSPTQYNIIDYVTIATLGNALDFGDLTFSGSYRMSCSSPTRGIFAGGKLGFSFLIDFVTIASTGNAADFGDLTTIRANNSGCSNSVRGIFGGGQDDPATPGISNVIDYITISSVGNAVDFGDLTVTRANNASFSSSTRGVFVGGRSPAYSNTIDYVTITTVGNATDFGDISRSRAWIDGLSDSHGGLGGI